MRRKKINYKKDKIHSGHSSRILWQGQNLPHIIGRKTKRKKVKSGINPKPTKPIVPAQYDFLMEITKIKITSNTSVEVSGTILNGVILEGQKLSKTLSSSLYQVKEVEIKKVGKTSSICLILKSHGGDILSVGDLLSTK